MNIEFWKKRRKELKLTYEELATLSGVSRRTIAGIFGGDYQYSSPTLNTVDAIERVLGISNNWTAEERAQGVVESVQRIITPEEDELLDLYAEVGRRFGTAKQEAVLTFLKQLLE